MIEQVNPEYTRAAREAQIVGEVRLAAVVETDGSVGRIRVTKSLDAKYGLDQAAIDATSRWKFEPAKKDGKPVPVRIELVLKFRLL